jgi:toxin-antitoxin system PIN domain toxin
VGFGFVEVILCDANVWVALALSGHPANEDARAWFEPVVGRNSVLFCRNTQQAFLRLMTSAAVLAPTGTGPLTNREAWATYDSLLADDRVQLADREPAGLETQWRQFASRGTASPKLWQDAYLAAFAVTGGHRLVTADAAFKQFAGLDVLVLGEAQPSGA